MMLDIRQNYIQLLLLTNKRDENQHGLLYESLRDLLLPNHQYLKGISIIVNSCKTLYRHAQQRIFLLLSMVHQFLLMNLVLKEWHFEIRQKTLCCQDLQRASLHCEDRHVSY